MRLRLTELKKEYNKNRIQGTARLTNAVIGEYVYDGEATKVSKAAKVRGQDRGRKSGILYVHLLRYMKLFGIEKVQELIEFET
jgi:hypothetical protein